MPPARDHRTEYQRRNKRARQLGFRNYYEMRKLGGSSTVTRTPEALPLRAQVSRRASLEAISLMRREGVALSRAAERAGVSPAAVKFWGGDAVDPSGAPRSGDRMLRRLLIISEGEVVDAGVRGSRQAALVGEYWNAVSRFLETGDLRPVAKFRGKTVAGHLLETDPDVLESLALSGEMHFEDIYSLAW